MNFGQPPADAFGQEPPDRIEVFETNRERVESITSPDKCSACHEQIDPPGFAFENYDSIGRFRSVDNGASIDSSGELKMPNGDVLTFSTGIELAHLLSTHPVVQECYTQQLLNYAAGAIVPSSDAVQEIKDSFKNNDNILELIVTIVSSGIFRTRRGTEP